jgi:trehalose-phosphatase
MKYVFENLSSIERKIGKKSLALFLDFDLTLSPLAKNPNNAFLPEPTKVNLKKIASLIPVVIITGRKLSDIKKRANIKNILYVGNHGLEHNLNKIKQSALIPTYMKNALLKAKGELMEIRRAYPEMIFEDKKYAVALGYRNVREKDIISLESILKKMERDINLEGTLEAHLEKKTFELRPKMEVSKGTSSLLALKIIQNRLRKEVVPIYIGDGETDENAFKVLKNGITIHVGKNNDSSARWYVHNPREVNLFLKWLAGIAK